MVIPDEATADRLETADRLTHRLHALAVMRRHAAAHLSAGNVGGRPDIATAEFVQASAALDDAAFDWSDDLLGVIEDLRGRLSRGELVERGEAAR